MEVIAPGVLQFDTLLGGWDRVTAGFLLVGQQPALVETGARSSVPAVRRALDAAGLGPHDLRWLVLTHIHLDHAGGVGDLAEAFPAATVVVHDRGARHLVDPSRLVASAALVYGPLLDSLYGRMAPVPATRVVSATDGMRLDIGGRFIRLIDSPGHAKHHLAVLVEDTGTLLVGDAVGVRLPDIGVLHPAVPPPDFDLDAAVNSLHTFAELRPEQVVLTHYGAVPDPTAALAEAEDQLMRWVEVARRALADHPGKDGVEAIAQALGSEVGPLAEHVPTEVRARMETLNGVHSNAAGLHRYLQSHVPT